MVNTSKYYSILQIEKSASLPELKKAYRRRVKELHPDRNPSPGAHEDFILLTEAYEYLLSLKTTGRKVDRQRVKSAKSAAWEEYQRKEARRRAEEFARMRYERFIRSNYYKNLVALHVIGKHVFFFLSIFFIVILPVTAYITGGFSVLIYSLLISVIGGSVSVIYTLNFTYPFNLVTFFRSLLHISKSMIFQAIVLTFLNFFIFFKIGLSTLLQINTLILIYLSAIVFSYILFKLFKKSKMHAQFISFCIAPFMVSVFLVINFVFSSDPETEKYEFEGIQTTTLIQLKDNVYRKYSGIRLFYDYSEIIDRKFVTYTFEEGLFGLRVVKKHEFE